MKLKKIKNLFRNLRKLSEIELPPDELKERIKPQKMATIIHVKDKLDKYLEK